MKILLTLLAACLLLTTVAFAGVEVATKGNFDRIIGGDLTLVKFYAPWCGHCKTLAPEFIKAAEMLNGVATLAEVDCTKEEALAQTYGIKGFPTLIVFRNGAKAEDYSGPRTADGIVSYMKAQVGPAMKPIENAAELDALKEESLPTCVVKTGSAKSDLVALLSPLANRFRTQMNFALVTDAAISPEDAMESITVYRRGTEREAYAGPIPMSTASLESFLTTAVLGYFGELGQETFQPYMEANRAKPLGWLFIDSNTDPALKAAMVAVGEKYRSRAILVYIDGDKFRPVSRQLGMPEGVEFPAFVMDFERNHHVMPFDIPVTAESVDAFVDQYLKGETTQSVMSEDVPATETVSGLTTVVGGTITKYTDGSRNILLLFYAPWCGHCQKLHPEYEKLAKSLESEDVVIAKIDATTNDFDREKFKVSGFPTIYFIPAGKAPITYEGDRSIEDMQTFVRSHMTPTAATDEGDL